MNHSNELSNVEKIKQLVDYLNLQRNAYYNENSPNISDAEYDRIFDELVELEKQTGFVLSNSPTQTVGYTPISELPKVKHPVPLLFLHKKLGNLSPITSLHTLMSLSQFHIKAGW